MMKNKLPIKTSIIPSEWSVIPCGIIFEEKSVKNTKGEINLSVYRDYGVIPRDSRDDNHNRVSEDISNYKLVEIGDLVLNKMKGWMGSIGLSNHRGIVSPSYTVMKSNREINIKYFNYLLRGELYRQIYESFSYGVRVGQWEIRYHDFKKIPLPFPPLIEQKKISLLIENKKEKVEKLIEKSLKKIEILIELKKATINKFITKGINQNIELKNSNIHWIGKIPKHWKVSKIGRHFKLERGRVISNLEISENPGDYPVYSSQTKNDGRLGKINSYDFQGEYVSWTTDGANAGTCFYREGKFNVTNVCGLISTHEIPFNYQYLSFFLNLGTKNYVRLDINPKLMNDMMSEISCLIVPLNEQIHIVNRINKKIVIYDQVINLERKKIKLLKEFVQSMISSFTLGEVRIHKNNE